MSSTDDHQVRGAGAADAESVEVVRTVPSEQEKGMKAPDYDAGAFPISPSDKEAKNVEVGVYGPGSSDSDNGGEKVAWHKTQRFKKWSRVFLHLAVFVVATG